MIDMKVIAREAIFTVGASVADLQNNHHAGVSKKIRLEPRANTSRFLYDLVDGAAQLQHQNKEPPRINRPYPKRKPGGYLGSASAARAQHTPRRLLLPICTTPRAPRNHKCEHRTQSRREGNGETCEPLRTCNFICQRSVMRVDKCNTELHDDGLMTYTNGR